MPTLTEGQLSFTFEDGWRAEKLDEWSYYRNQFQKLGSGLRQTCSKCGAELRCGACKTLKTAGLKCVDFLALDPGNCCWLIEVKDYRQQRRTKTIALPDEIALKVRDTLAALLGATGGANDRDERSLARDAVRTFRFRVVLHLEQPAKHSKLFPRAIDPADVLQRLKQLLRSVDPHPQVCEIGRLAQVGWSVRSTLPEQHDLE